MTVSYLITLYNKEKFIGVVMDAVLAERAATGGEIVIYDDCSTDRSPEIARDRVEEAAGVRIVRGAKNRGVAFATNFLINAASQPYTRLVDADDVLVKGSTAHLLRQLKEHNLGFIHGLSTEAGNNEQGLENQPFAECFMIANPVRRILRHAIAGPSPSLFVTAELRKAIPLPEWVQRTQDFLITLRIANRGIRMGYVTDIAAVGPPADRTDKHLSASLAAMFAEICRDVAQDSLHLLLADLRYASRRYAARAAKYFRRRGRSKLSRAERFALWRWQSLAWFASRQACVARLAQTADWLDRDRDVLVTGPARR